jgi:subtilisin family serine protease
MNPKGTSLHIGLNAVDPTHYSNWNGELNACENDAAFYKTIAEKSGFEKIRTLLTEDATSKNLFQFFDNAAKELNEGDILFVSYSGHGGSIPDLNRDEKDGMDETWCLYDRQVLDDELYENYAKFKKGVRILVVSDSCYSGSVTRASPTRSEVGPEDKQNYIRSRQAPAAVLLKTYTTNKAEYDGIGTRSAGEGTEIDAYVLLLAACQDDEEALEVWDHGLFTAKVIKVLEGKVNSYNNLFELIKKDFTIRQKPNLFRYGNAKYDFMTQSPFSINGAASIQIDVVSGKKSGKKKTKMIVELGKSANIHKFPNANSRNWKSRGQSAETPGKKESEFVTIDTITDEKKEWDTAYQTFLDTPDAKFVEPDFGSPYLEAREASRGETKNDYLSNWPQPDASVTEFIWHLDDDHSQLRRASDFVESKLAANAKVRIGHIDTGYLPDHPSTPRNLLKDLGVSFVGDEFGTNKGIDKLNSGFPAEQDGHGCATLALLAGNNITIEQSYSSYAGFFGAIPFAEVIPIRICETVFNLFNANDVADGIDYAVDYGCEVVTMSMAGYPTRRLAHAINNAYEKGVTVVTATGNNWKSGIQKFAPKAILYPARFQRVIAATGACYNEEPYDLDANAWFRSRMDGGETMQGNWGPESAMKKAIAAYTPNVAWATSSKAFRFYRSGGGTSSATPQVAAAAALWIAYNRSKIEAAGIDKSWKKVEALRWALFNTADKSYPAYQKYYGNGIVRAFDALDAFDFSKVGSLSPSKPAKVGITGFVDFLSGWFRGRGVGVAPIDASKEDGLKEMLSVEMIQLINRDPKLMQYAEVMDLEGEEGENFFKNDSVRKSFAKKLSTSEYASNFLKGALANI